MVVHNGFVLTFGRKNICPLIRGIKMKRVSSNIFVYLVVFTLLAFSVNAVDLGTASDFGVLGGSTVTNTGTTNIARDLGVSPGSAITGFPPGVVSGTIHAADAVALQAQSDVTVAYNSLAGMACNTDLTGQDLGGLTLTPGVYCFSSSAQLTGTLTLDGQGNSDSVFIIQMGSSLTTASSSYILLINSASPCNVFWQVGSSATLGTGTSFEGNILALSSITFNTGSDLKGRALARNGAVTLDTNIILLSCENTPGTSTLTVTKIVNNDNGGTAVASDFALFIDNDQVMNGIANDIAPGTYIVSENGISGYDGTFSGDCNTDGSITLNPGDEKTCIITNTYAQNTIPEFGIISGLIALISAAILIIIKRKS